MSNAKAKLEYFQQQADEESSLQRRIADFKKALSQNEVLEEFDRDIFESIIEKVIVGGYDENAVTMKTEKKIPIKSLSYIKQDLQTELEMQRSGLGNPLVSETKRKKCVPMSVTR